jgi:hypothetical protein
MTKNLDFSRFDVISQLPNYFRPEDGDDLPEGLIGSTIVGFGTLAEPRSVHGGGLVIDYQRVGEQQTRRLVLACTDVAMWIAYQGIRSGGAIPGESEG